jgi:hypothetical protein
VLFGLAVISKKTPATARRKKTNDLHHQKKSDLIRKKNPLHLLTFQPEGGGNLAALPKRWTGYLLKAETIRRRATPAAAARPVPNRSSEEGSGTEGGGGVTVPGPAATFPVLPVTPDTSEAKKKLPPFPIKFETLTPAASVTVNDSGPGLTTEAPGPQLMPEQLTE